MVFLDIFPKYGSWIGIGVILIIIIVIIILLGVSLSKNNNNQSEKNEIANIREQLQEIRNKINSGQISKQLRQQIVSGTIDMRGPPGAKGDTGASGGIFEEKGILRNLSKPDLVTDRMYGNGKLSVAYLADKNYTTHQNWTLMSNNSITNKYGGCLEGDTSSKDIYMSQCNRNSNQLWQYDNQGKIRLKSNPTQCLGVKYEGELMGTPKIENGKAGKDRNHSNIYRLKMVKCDDRTNPESQSWSFY